MGKTVYSLVLNDEVVAAIDELAARRGYSRSALVNHVLADYASVSSPQQRQRHILDTVLGRAQDAGLRPHTQSAGCLTLRTTLSYKYNPALSYTLELWDNGEQSGQLRVSLRSQNQPLLDYFQHFFLLWEGLEEKYLKRPPAPQQRRMEPKRYLRDLRQPQMEQQALGDAMAGYITMMDSCIKTFFQNLDDASAAVARTEAAYRLLLESSGGAKGL